MSASQAVGWVEYTSDLQENHYQPVIFSIQVLVGFELEIVTCYSDCGLKTYDARTILKPSRFGFAQSVPGWKSEVKTSKLQLIGFHCHPLKHLFHPLLLTSFCWSLKLRFWKTLKHAHFFLQFICS